MNRSRIALIGGATAVVVFAVAAAIYMRKPNEADGQTSDSGARIDSIAKGSVDASGAENAFPSDVAIPVEGASVIQGMMVMAVSAAGEAAAWRQASVSSLVAGELKALNARENSAVDAGQLLAAIDPAPYELELKEAEARLRQVEAQFRTETLFDDRIEASVRAERQKSARAKTGLDGAELAVLKAKMNLSRAGLVAPFQGRVASVKVVLGQWIRQGDELLTLVDISRVKIDVQVLESEVGMLTPGRSARVTLAAFPGEVFSGRIETINPMVDKTTRSAKVVVALANPGGRILPGMYARVALDARQLPDRVMVPRSAIIERDNPRRKLVFVFEGDATRGRAKWRYVTTGAENETMVEIVDNPGVTEMVRAGEIVLIGGHHTLVHDAQVRIVQNTEMEGGRPR